MLHLVLFIYLAIVLVAAILINVWFIFPVVYKAVKRFKARNRAMIAKGKYVILNSNI